MKTIKQLYDEGLMSGGTYKALYRGMLHNNDFIEKWFFELNHDDFDEVKELTVKDLFDILGEEGLSKLSSIGAKRLAELKSLV